ncbi:MAG: hypothetical protein AMJ84_02370 [Acidithiobacillales bacterium SM23_46]|nr:MAG: hypothetical protein AMJ84_02370 [Acidithiobacillales bacterium SM23_46]
MLVKFFVDAVKDDVATAKEGRPIFKEVEMIDIRIPGSKDNIVVRPVRPKDIDRFPRHYAAFKQRTQGESVVGTPLEQWPLLTKAQVEELKFFNIRTVEQLAGAPDSTGQKFMGFNGLKQKATDFIAAAQGSAPFIALREENESMKLTIQQMQDEMKDLRKQLKRALKE